ncbi:MAG: DsbE family thiol:disulfide interchange protein [Hyphomicrobiales bacterium]
MSAETEKAQNPAKRRLLVMLPLLLFTGLALVFLLQLFAGDPSKLPSALIGKKVPEFSLPAVEGLEGVETFDSKALEGPGVKLVNFWASWCPPCRAEHPFLMELAKRDDLQVLGINQKDQAENARRFLGLHGNPYAKVGADPKGRVSIDWGVYGLPETFVIDAKGNIRFKYVGPITQDVLQTLLPEIEKAKQPL